MNNSKINDIYVIANSQSEFDEIKNILNKKNEFQTCSCAAYILNSKQVIHHIPQGWAWTTLNNIKGLSKNEVSIKNMYNLLND